MDITTYTVNANIAKEIKIVQISDLHGRPYGKIIDAVQRLGADAAVLTGDLIDGKRPQELDTALGFLTKCAQILPTYYSLGNHEKELGEDSFFKIRRTGAHLLNNKCESFKDITIGGLNSGYMGLSEKRLRKTPEPDTDWIGEFEKINSYKILLCHHPEYYEPYLKGRRIDLILSGHAHGGQWRFFSRGIFAPGQGFLPKYTSGMHDSKLVISRGLANTVKPVPRLFNKRELVMIRLIPQSN